MGSSFHSVGVPTHCKSRIQDNTSRGVLYFVHLLGQECPVDLGILSTICCDIVKYFRFLTLSHITRLFSNFQFWLWCYWQHCRRMVRILDVNNTLAKEACITVHEAFGCDSILSMQWSYLDGTSLLLFIFKQSKICYQQKLCQIFSLEKTVFLMYS